MIPIEAESTLNQLLTCMDGLVTRESGRPVVVIAATNRPEEHLAHCWRSQIGGPSFVFVLAWMVSPRC